ncbi:MULTISPECIES: transporter [unclassified Bacillus (in: firmicutes)]|uniref:transporter n=1 Tax=unclassified Bacillus (in: firmicutes) TaxID=185979 RepID=UPI0020C8A6B1|nr:MULTISPECIES: transporter [unclassified Bacillus (in: firmicutes)]
MRQQPFPPGFPGGGPGGFPGGGPGGFPGGGPGGFPGGGPGGFPGGGPGGFPGGGGGFPGGGGGGQSGPPSSPPPGYEPQEGPSTFAVDPGGIRRCLFRYTFIWLNNGRRFWFYPTFVGRTSIAGYRWRNFRWVYYGTDLHRIRSFRCN